MMMIIVMTNPDLDLFKFKSTYLIDLRGLNDLKGLFNDIFLRRQDGYLLAGLSLRMSSAVTESMAAGVAATSSDLAIGRSPGFRGESGQLTWGLGSC